MKKILMFLLCIFALTTILYCGQPSKIELTDGSIINGEVVSYTNGVYTINTPTFGEIKVGAKKVSKIESVSYTLPGTSANPIAQTDNPTQSQVSTYGQKLMENPENAAIVVGLTSNPALQDMAADPEIMEAAKKNDIQALMKNPKFMNIVNSPEMQEAVKKLKK